MSSSVPVAIPALMALAGSALPLGAQVYLGTNLPVFQPGPGDVTGEGSAITLQVESVHFDEDEFAELGPSYRHEEHYTIACCLYAWAGDSDFNQRMLDAYAVYSDLSVAIANAPQLNIGSSGEFGSGSWFRLGWTRQLDFTPAPSAQGFSTAMITFEVQCQARVTSLV